MRVPVPGGHLHVEETGSGPMLLLMHGGLGPDHTMFRPWMDALGDVARVVFYDHRGGGRSVRSDDLSDMDHDTLTSDADAIRAHLGEERMFLLGHSYGGMLALEYALRYPERLLGLIPCCTAPAWDYEDDITRRAHAKGPVDAIAAFESGVGPDEDDDERYAERSRRMAPLYWHRWDPEAAARMHAETRYSAKAFWRSEELLAGWGVAERLGDIDTPSLVIAGGDDWVTPAEQAERIHAGLPNSRLVVFPDSGHYPFVEEHDAFVETVAGWITGLIEEG